MPVCIIVIVPMAMSVRDSRTLEQYAANTTLHPTPKIDSGGCLALFIFSLNCKTKSESQSSHRLHTCLSFYCTYVFTKLLKLYMFIKMSKFRFKLVRYKCAKILNRLCSRQFCYHTADYIPRSIVIDGR